MNPHYPYLASLGSFLAHIGQPLTIVGPHKNIAKGTTDPGVDCFDQKFWLCRFGSVLELITFEILAAERLRLMGFDNRLIIDCFANVVNILTW